MIRWARGANLRFELERREHLAGVKHVVGGGEGKREAGSLPEVLLRCHLQLQGNNKQLGLREEIRFNRLFWRFTNYIYLFI